LLTLTSGARFLAVSAVVWGAGAVDCGGAAAWATLAVSEGESSSDGTGICGVWSVTRFDTKRDLKASSFSASMTGSAGGADAACGGGIIGTVCTGAALVLGTALLAAICRAWAF
jgi:hypothetical protein